MARAARSPRNGSDDLVLERFLPYRLSVLSNRVSRAIAARYAQAFDLTIPEWRVVALLGRASRISAGEIAEAAEVDKVAISRAVSRLIQAGRVRAETDAQDARRQLLSLTRSGQSVYARIAPVAIDCEQRLLANLTLQERADLDRLLARLTDAAKTL